MVSRSIGTSPAGSLLGCWAERSVGKGAGRDAGGASPALGLRVLGVVRGGSRPGVGGAASPAFYVPPHRRPAGGHDRESRVRELRLHPDAALAAGRHRPLLVQRLRSLQQDERPQPAPHQAAEASGECERRPALWPGADGSSCRAARPARRPAPDALVGTGAARPRAARVSTSVGTKLYPSLCILWLPAGAYTETGVWVAENFLPHTLNVGNDILK